LLSYSESSIVILSTQISQGSVGTRLRRNGNFVMLYTVFPCKYDSKRILKICYSLTKL